LATNNVSKGTAKAQEAVTMALAAWGVASNTIATVATLIPFTIPGFICSKTPVPVCIFPPMGGATGYGLNTDFMGAALDGMLLHDAMTKNAKWSEDIPELQAQIRQIGGIEDLEGECEDDKEGTCNATNATLNGTEVYVTTLKNVGLEALKDVSGSLLITTAQLIDAAPTIQKGFGSEVDGIDTSQSIGKKTTSGVILWSDYLPDSDDNTTSGGTRQTTITKIERTDQEIKDISDRKLAHLQLTGTAGVARADLGATVARSEQEAFDRLSSYVGSGDGLIANIQVLSGLDLTLAQRLNLLNMLQGQQVANDAAMALQFVETE